ncbi:MAG TPA: hypothetical protein VJ697_11360 [Nitrososphaeraceae archaeon]|nr:hypothetical protein [Nitrososphaeraceae archaeon]
MELKQLHRLQSLRISNNTAKRTMTEFKGLELVNMNRIDDNSNSEYKITLKSKFNWFLTNEFKILRDGFKPTDNKEFLKKKKSNTAIRKNTPVQKEEKQDEQEKEEDQQEK